MAGTTIPGETVGTEYSSGFDYDDLDTSQTLSSNFNSGTLGATQGIGETNYLICDRTGFRVSVREGLKKEWNGLLVRVKSWERRQPMDFLRPKAESQLAGSPRPEPDDIYVTSSYPSGVTADDL